MKAIHELFLYRNVLMRLVGQQLTLRYRRTALGYFWTLINPLVMMSVMAAVFSSLYKTDFKIFAIFLFAGMIPWNYFSTVVTQSGSSFINNEGLIKKIYLPKIVFPLSVSIALLIDSAFSFVALLIIMIFMGASIGSQLLVMPIAFLLLFVFSIGVGLLMSVATVFFRDLQHIVVIALQGLFFLTPILYKNDSLIGPISYVVELNPILPFIDLFRLPLCYGLYPDFRLIMQALIISMVTFAIGIFFFMREEKNIVFRL